MRSCHQILSPILITAVLAALAGCGDAPTEPHPAETPAVDETAWSYETLDELERAVVDRGRDVRTWEQVHRGFADAVAQSVARSRR